MRDLRTATAYLGCKLHSTVVIVLPVEDVKFEGLQFCVSREKLLFEFFIVFTFSSMDVALLRTLAVLFDRVRDMQIVWQIFVIIMFVFFKLLKVFVPLTPNFMFVCTTAAIDVYMPSSLYCIFASLESLLWRISLY